MTMNKLTKSLMVVTGLIFSCNNSQTTTNEQTSVTEDTMSLKYIIDLSENMG
jgi:hypothetical protein